VSALALGTLTFGNETSEAGSFAQLDRFVSAGGTLIDTADVYADGRSEQILCRWLASRTDGRERAVIATKGRFPTTEDPNGHGLSRRHLTGALDASLRRRAQGRRGPRRLDVPGGDRLNHSPPGSPFGHPRCPHPGSARRQPGRRGPSPSFRASSILMA
jgi:hypothetical protein